MFSCLLTICEHDKGIDDSVPVTFDLDTNFMDMKDKTLYPYLVTTQGFVGCRGWLLWGLCRRGKFVWSARNLSGSQ